MRARSSSDKEAAIIRQRRTRANGRINWGNGEDAHPLLWKDMLPAENLLAQETSPYLQQHAGNPVHWRPWGAAALAEARERDRPILISIGYAACHWCHVMAHESFEDEETAALMNRLFVNIKVDREER